MQVKLLSSIRDYWTRGKNNSNARNHVQASPHFKNQHLHNALAYSFTEDLNFEVFIVSSSKPPAA